MFCVPLIVSTHSKYFPMISFHKLTTLGFDVWELKNVKSIQEQIESSPELYTELIRP